MPGCMWPSWFRLKNNHLSLLPHKTTLTLSCRFLRRYRALLVADPATLPVAAHIRFLHTKTHQRPPNFMHSWVTGCLHIKFVQRMKLVAMCKSTYFSTVYSLNYSVSNDTRSCCMIMPRSSAFTTDHKGGDDAILWEDCVCRAGLGNEKRSVLGFVLCSHPGFGLAVKALWSASRYTLMLGYCELFIRGWKLNTHGFSFAGIDEMVLCVFRNGKPFQALFQRFYPYIPVQFVTWSLAIRIVSQTWSGPSKRKEKKSPTQSVLKTCPVEAEFLLLLYLNWKLWISGKTHLFDPPARQPTTTHV